MLIYAYKLKKDEAVFFSSSFLFYQKKPNFYLDNSKNYQPEICSVKMREPKNQMLDIMEPPCRRALHLWPILWLFM